MTSLEPIEISSFFHFLFVRKQQQQQVGSYKQKGETRVKEKGRQKEEKNHFVIAADDDNHNNVVGNILLLFTAEPLTIVIFFLLQRATPLLFAVTTCQRSARHLNFFFREKFQTLDGMSFSQPEATTTTFSSLFFRRNKS